MTEIARTPEPPYWAVIFTNQRKAGGDDEYSQAAARMEQLALDIPGYIGIETVRDEVGFGVTISYWASEEAISRWRDHPEHLETQARGRADWYERYELRIARVERSASFTI